MIRRTGVTMRKSAVFWIIAFTITLGSAYYQRRTGPTYPIRGSAALNAGRISYRLERSHGGETGCPIEIKTGDPAISGLVEWKHHGVAEDFAQLPMISREGTLTAELPHQPPAGRLDYRIILNSGGGSIVLPKGEPAVIRFKGDVPLFILISHVLAMFGAMLLSTRSGLEVFDPDPRLKPLTYWTLGFLIAGGAILGPIMQKHAFGAYWTGWPFGKDLTDNKTLIALLIWIVAVIAVKMERRAKLWVAVASVILLTVYMIPHSMWGSELEYARQKQPRISSDY